MKTATRRRPRIWVTIILALMILVPACYGFGSKFREFLLLAPDPDGAFTIMPILNYLLVSAGFLCLFFWAIMHGMFRDIEKPKFTMMANERRLDAEERLEQEETDTSPLSKAEPAEREWWQHGRD